MAALIRERGAASVAELVNRFEVSDMTVRRDLDALAAQATVQKVHGGAVSDAPRRAVEPGFDAKISQMQSEKATIAEEAASLVRPGMSIALSAGTTTWALAYRLSEVEDLTVVTNSVKISDVFQQRYIADRSVILSGGIRTRSDALVGPTAVSALRDIHVDLAFLGAHGVSAEAGFTTPNYLEAETNRALAAAGQRTSVICDHSKWGVVGVMTFADAEDVDVLIMDRGLAPDAATLLREQIPDVRLADVSGTERQRQ